MRFAVDLDGVVSNFNEGFVREVNNIWPGKLPIGYEPQDWHYSGDLSKSEIDEAWEAINNKPNWWMSLRPYPGNLRAVAVHRIRHPQDEIFYVTSRSKTKGMPTMHQSQIWLEQCGIGGLGTAVIVSDGWDKSDIFNALEVDASIDDRLEAVIEHNRKTTGACLLMRPWNRHERPSNLRTVETLEEFFRHATPK